MVFSTLLTGVTFGKKKMRRGKVHRNLQSCSLLKRSALAQPAAHRAFGVAPQLTIIAVASRVQSFALVPSCRRFENLIPSFAVFVLFHRHRRVDSGKSKGPRNRLETVCGPSGDAFSQHHAALSGAAAPPTLSASTR
jgi:hypothetical protein